jgi:hypothetical protein
MLGRQSKLNTANAQPRQFGYILTEEIQWFKNSYKTSSTIAKSCWMHLIHAYLEAVYTIIWLPRAALSSEIIKKKTKAKIAREKQKQKAKKTKKRQSTCKDKQPKRPRKNAQPSRSRSSKRSQPDTPVYTPYLGSKKHKSSDITHDNPFLAPGTESAKTTNLFYDMQ